MVNQPNCKLKHDQNDQLKKSGSLQKYNLDMKLVVQELI